MSYDRDAILAEVRDNLYETTANLWTDAQLVKHMRAEIRSLPRKNIYLEEIHTTDTVTDQLDYILPTGTLDVEKVERNWGTDTRPDWQEIKGWDEYGGALYLAERPSTVWTMRVHIKKSFADLTAGATVSDVSDDKIEVVVWGTCLRAYRQLMGYFSDAANWDSISKPDGLSMSQIQGWYRDARQEYKELVQTYRTTPRPRDIDLVG